VLENVPDAKSQTKFELGKAMFSVMVCTGMQDPDGGVRAEIEAVTVAVTPLTLPMTSYCTLVLQEFTACPLS
jgi:hypothetical protein